MTKPVRTTPTLRFTGASLPFAFLAALGFAALATPALAQGTKEQREACAPDAINLCSDTIPDVSRTEACMRRHFKELSPACQTAFNSATGSAPETAPPRREEGVARAEPGGRPGGYPEDDIPGAQNFGYVEPNLDDGLETSRNVTAQLCAEGMIDPYTCRRSERFLHMR